MSRFMSAVWVIQFWLLLAAAALVLVRPEAVLYFLEECVTLPTALQSLPDPAPACVIIAKDREAQGLFAITRLLAPFLLIFSLFSLHAVMREEERVRRLLSFVFAFIYVVLTAFLYTDSFSDAGLRHPDFLPRTLLAALVTLALFTGYSAIQAGDRSHRVTWLLVLAGYASLAALLARGAPAATIAKLSLLVFVVDTLLADFERLRARVFCLVLLFPALLAVMDALSPSSSHALDDEPLAMRIFLGVTVVCVVIHALYAVWPTEAAARRLSGSANTRPSALWVIWLLQGLGYLALAGSLIWAHQRGNSVLLEGMIDPAYEHLFADLDEVFPAFIASIGLFSFTGMQSSREWVWKAHCAIFAAFYVALLLCGLFVWNGDLFMSWTPALALPALVLLGVHLRFYYSRLEWFSEEVGEGPDGWVLVDLVLGPLLMLRTLLSRRRAMHARGVAAHGTMRVLPRTEGGYPEHDFFQATDHPLTVQIRYGNERSQDDADADARGAALRVTAPDRRSFDLLLGTGAYSGAENIVELGVIAALSALGYPGRWLLSRSRRFLEGGLAGLRRAPASYAELWYSSQAVRFWVAKNNERYLVRYRLRPDGPEAHETVDPEPTLDDFLHRRRRRDRHLATDYLRRELKMRLEGGLALGLRLEAQLHRIEPGDGLQWYNPGADWHAADHPWIGLAEITLEDVLPDDVAERLCFNPDNAPSSLGTPVAAGFFDYRSIADSERRVMRRVQSLRVWMLNSFGLPSFSPKPME